MQAETGLSRRGLILHDGLAFLALFAVSLALLCVTLFLFKSFEGHREDLATEWSERGRMALQKGHAEEAVGALRTALTFSPDDEPDQLLLAQALAAAGHTDEATNYYLNLWAARPGDGWINLQLARLAQVRHEDREAEDRYRAALYGSWEGDGVVRRREVRLELTDFLIAQHKNTEARNELYVVAGNSPESVALDMGVGARLEKAGYVADALTFYKKAMALEARGSGSTGAPVAAAGRAAFALGEYAEAERLLGRAAAESRDGGLQMLADQARRLQELTLTRDQPVVQRAEHILVGSKIAQLRLQACVAGEATSNGIGLMDLTGRWAALLPTRRTLARDAEVQDRWASLIEDTELRTEDVRDASGCGAPAGDNALLLRLALAAQKEAAGGKQSF